MSDNEERQALEEALEKASANRSKALSAYISADEHEDKVRRELFETLETARAERNKVLRIYTDTNERWLNAARALADYDRSQEFKTEQKDSLPDSDPKVPSPSTYENDPLAPWFMP